MIVPRYDIVPIPPALRSGLTPGGFMEFQFDTVEGMFTFRAIDVVDRIAPRPLLLLHSSTSQQVSGTQALCKQLLITVSCRVTTQQAALAHLTT